MDKKIIVVALGVAIIFGAGGFYVGMKYDAKRTDQTTMRGNFGNGTGFDGGQRGIQNGQHDEQSGQGRQGGQRIGGGFVGGEIISKDDKSITVKSQDGNSRIIFFSDSTTIGKTAAGTAADLSAGQQIMVNGRANADGTIAAQNIQIRPIESN